MKVGELSWMGMLGRWGAGIDPRHGRSTSRYMGSDMAHAYGGECDDSTLHLSVLPGRALDRCCGGSWNEGDRALFYHRRKAGSA